jgi:hypothetical protein
MGSRRQHVYAVVRIDLPDSESVDEIAGDPALWITVKEIVPTREEADKEVQRLNALNADKGCIYFSQVTRLFRDGRMVEP